jgi:membrane fusion protein, multidrug efflux system
MHLSSEARTRRTLGTVVLAGVIGIVPLVLLSGCAGKEAPAVASKKGPGAGRGGGAVPVSVAKVVRRDVPISIQVVGNVEPYLSVAVKSQVNGEITQVFFHEGDSVKKGDQLLTIDARTYEGQVNQLQANLARDQAILAQAESNLARDQAQEKYAQATATRYTSLFERNLISKEMMEQARTSAEAVSAAVRADMANIQSARATAAATTATLENAKVQLGYTVIRSPMNGRTGNLDVKQGNVVSTSMTLMSINQVEPVYVTFAVPEARLRSIRKSQAVSAVTQDNPTGPQSGQVSFIDNSVDPATGTIRVKATFPNKGHNLWPGQFVRVSLMLETMPDALLVPGQVVQSGQDGSFVFVVKADKTVESRPVVPGQRVDEDVVIQKGLSEGEVVVTEGQLRLAPGSRVQITETP